ncbi:MAG: adenylosuccinate lyase [SAR324 cluster bacterium]|nr:adenylosuccinate lyase [SAR324 cluster bacterium]
MTRQYEETKLTAISPLDGRYKDKLAPVSDYFSEASLIKHRFLVEIEWLLYLTNLPEFSDFKITDANRKFLKGIINNFSLVEAKGVKAIEEVLRHDVKAVEKYIQQLLQINNLSKLAPLVHFGLTSEDVNSTAYSLLIKGFYDNCWQKEAKNLLNNINQLAQKTKQKAMVARTHGQVATPTTMGKEMEVFYHRLARQNSLLADQEYLAKFSGASGNFNVHHFTFPQIDWPQQATIFLRTLNLKNNPYTTQIESHDFLAEIFHNLIRWNSILLDFCRDIWSYIALGYFQQATNIKEVGSSTMPHKVNPIDFENAEGNLGLANSLFNHLASKLPISRWQRDLTDSTVLRNVGVAWGHSLLAIQSIEKGLSKLTLNEQKLTDDLSLSWELLAEPLQSILRLMGRVDAYEVVKDKVKGKKLDLESWQLLVEELALPPHYRQRLLDLTPHTYLGYSDIQIK